jgi:hypothetical protein
MGQEKAAQSAALAETLAAQANRKLCAASGGADSYFRE